MCGAEVEEWVDGWRVSVEGSSLKTTLKRQTWNARPLKVRVAKWLGDFNQVHLINSAV